MRNLVVFNHVSLDGYFVGDHGDSSFAHTGNEDPEYAAWQKNNAGMKAEMVFGRVTYELMESYWPTARAKKESPEFAEAMNNSPKVVFSKKMDRADWSNTRLLKGNLASEVKKLKSESGPDLIIFGSGTIISQLAQDGLIDAYTIVVNPVVLGKGRTMFEGLSEIKKFKLGKTKTFKNGKVVLNFEAE